MRYRIHRYLEGLCVEHCSLEPEARQLPTWLFRIVSRLEFKLRRKPPAPNRRKIPFFDMPLL